MKINGYKYGSFNHKLDHEIDIIDIRDPKQIGEFGKDELWQ